ncbi:methyltransferase domain-containing protein [Massilia sp. TS11]|uniref:methyltransferase domain-containing protein n=1 Tax=Massilia sp. TS11 TaxID=2908003 RepID=UPI001ED9F114|nr:methyltransferase domain-containing protein [Massilia sp. TS11]MCG2582829.1 class I SAM-dependent methyltransferase [Massilia sp. TS11]
MNLYRVKDRISYIEHQERQAVMVDAMHQHLAGVMAGAGATFFVPGYSYPAGRMVDFLVDDQYAWEEGVINWRERVVCPITGFNNRMRATIHILDLEGNLYPDSTIYLAEQRTPFYSFLKARYPNLIGSEPAELDQESGMVDDSGIRREHAAQLSLPDASVELVCSLDTLQGEADIPRALREYWRVLKVGACLIWSVPFARERYEHEDASDLPSSARRCGWQMLDQARAAGFFDVYALCVSSIEFAYLGEEQLLFVARK